MSVAWGSFARLLVLFRLGPHRFALPAEHVVEICEAPEGGPTSGSFPHRGDALPLVDLRRRFRVEASTDPRGVLVVRPPGSLGRVALLVDEVDAVIPCGTESMLEIPDPLHPFLGAYLDGLFVLPREKTVEEADLVAVLAPGALGIDDRETARDAPGGRP